MWSFKYRSEYRTGAYPRLALAVLMLVATGLITVLSRADHVNAMDLEPQCRIGLLAPLSGAASTYGIAPQRGIALALHDISHPTLSVLHEDHRGDSKNAVTAAQGLLMREPDLDALIVVGASQALALEPVLARHKVPLLAVASDARLGTNGPDVKKRSGVLRVWPSVQEEGALLAKGMELRGFSRALVVHDQDDYSRAVGEGIASPALTVQRLEAPTGEADIRPLLKRAFSTFGTEGALGLCVRAGRVGAFALQARELGFAGQIFGCVTTDNEQEWTSARGALTGALYGSVEVRPEFKTRYSTRYGEASFLGGAAALYDLTIMLDAACRGRESRDTMVQALRAACDESKGKRTFASVRWNCTQEVEGASMTPGLALYEVEPLAVRERKPRS